MFLYIGSTREKERESQKTILCNRLYELKRNFMLRELLCGIDDVKLSKPMSSEHPYIIECITGRSYIDETYIKTLSERSRMLLYNINIL
jgi:hypothetical protein